MNEVAFEGKNRRESAYRDSTLFEKVRASKKIAFLDIDSTLTGNPEIVAMLRSELERQGCAIVFVTSRTEEMIMSEEAFRATNPDELKRPAAHLFRTPEGECIYADPKTMPLQVPFIDADAIAASTGTRLFLKKKTGGYKIDSSFEEGMRQDPGAWRKGVSELLRYAGPEYEAAVSPINVDGNFEKNLVDVYPPNYRVTLEFFKRDKAFTPTGSTAEGSAVSEEEAAVLLLEKTRFEKMVADARQNPDTPAHIQEILSNICLTDDSNPEKGLYLLYITPDSGNKKTAVDRIIENAVEEAGIPREELHVVLAGDSYPDVAMGLYGAQGTQATFILAGKSRLSDVFTKSEVIEFAGEDFSEVKAGLSGDFENGVAHFTGPTGEGRRVIVCDKMFPGMNPPESVFVALKTIFQ